MIVIESTDRDPLNTHQPIGAYAAGINPSPGGRTETVEVTPVAGRTTGFRQATIAASAA